MNYLPEHEGFRTRPSFEELRPRDSRGQYRPRSVAQYIGLVPIEDAITHDLVKCYLQLTFGQTSFLVRSSKDIIDNLKEYTPSKGYQICTDSENTLELIAKVFLGETKKDSWSETWKRLYNGEEIPVGKYKLLYQTRSDRKSSLLRIKGLPHNANLEIISLHQWSLEKLLKDTNIPGREDNPEGRAKTLCQLAYHISCEISGKRAFYRELDNLLKLYDEVTQNHLLLASLQGGTKPEVRFLAYQCCQHTHWVEVFQHGYVPHLLEVDSTMFYLWASAQVISPMDIEVWIPIKNNSDFYYYLENGPFKSLELTSYNLKPVMGFFSADIEIYPTVKTPIQFSNLHGMGRRSRFITLQEILYLLENPQKGKVHRIFFGEMGFSDADPPGKAFAKAIWMWRNSAKDKPILYSLLKLGAAAGTGRLFQKNNKVLGIGEDREYILEWTEGQFLCPEVYATALAIARIQLDKAMDMFGEENIIFTHIDGFGVDASKLTQDQLGILKRNQELGGLRLDHEGPAIIVNSDLLQIEDKKEGLVKSGNQGVILKRYLKEENPTGDFIQTFIEERIPLSATFGEYNQDLISKVGSTITIPRAYLLEKLNRGRFMKTKPNKNILLTEERFRTSPLNVRMIRPLVIHGKEEDYMDIPFEEGETNG